MRKIIPAALAVVFLFGGASVPSTGAVSNAQAAPAVCNMSACEASACDMSSCDPGRCESCPGCPGPCGPCVIGQ